MRFLGLGPYSVEVLVNGLFQEVLVCSSQGCSQRAEPNVGLRIELHREGNGFGLGWHAGRGSAGLRRSRAGHPSGSHLSVVSFDPKVYAELRKYVVFRPNTDQNK
jgi:hypothetical protein